MLRRTIVKTREVLLNFLLSSGLRRECLRRLRLRPGIERR
jgi:hypothetical protein